jgi:hypothetical protein
MSAKRWQTWGTLRLKMNASLESRVWHHMSMVKRSTRMAKRDDFLNTVRAMEESIGSPQGKKPAEGAISRQDELKAAEKPSPAREEK